MNKKAAGRPKKNIIGNTQIQQPLNEMVGIENNEVKEIKMGKRTPLYKQKAIGIKEKPGFHRRQVVEAPGRVLKFIEAGYRPCNDKDANLRDSRVQHDTQLGSVMREVVNWKPGAASQTGIWMEIPIEYYEEDQRAKQQANDERTAMWNPKNMQKANPDLYYGSELKDDKI